MATIYAFGPFRLDARSEILFRGVEPVPLGRRAVALPRILVERPGAPISKSSLIEGAWPGVAVEENNLSVQIRALRRALEKAGGASWIETMPRRGYRFVGPAVIKENTTESHIVLPDRAAIAVLPFANMSSDPEQDHFANGMTEDIITALSKLRWLSVLARNSTLVYKGTPVSITQVGAELGVPFVLEGSVRISADQVRVTGQLIEVDTGGHLWADHYDQQIKRNGLFAIQDQITERVVTAIDSAIRGFKSASQQGSTELGGQKLPQSNIVIRVPRHFVGRDEALAEIEQALGHNDGPVAITALHGLRGVGKTTLAAAYAEHHREDYRATWWIRAQTVTSMCADIIALGVRLGWIGADEMSAALPEERAFFAVMEHLRLEGEGILLIYDNAIDAESLKPYLPRGGTARVLVTSNAYAWRGVAAPVEIRLWPKEIGADYLVARTGCVRERDVAEALSEALGGLPLAHEQAAAYCEGLGAGLGEYRRRFEAATVEFLDDKDHAPAEYHDHRTVAGTFTLGIEEAAKRNPAAEPLIVAAALIAPEPIPLLLFAEAHDKLGEPLAAALAGDGLYKAVAVLRAFGLVGLKTIGNERNALKADAIHLHRLVREIAAARSKGEARDQMLLALASALAVVYPDDAFTNPASWPLCASLTPHVLATFETEMGDTAAGAAGASLLERSGMYFHGRAAYSETRPLYAGPW
jgi:TolB-like protein